MANAATSLGAALLLWQVAVGPVLAADSRLPSGSSTSADRPGSFTAEPIGDLKVELDAGWWVGNVRHSRFKVSNVADGTVYAVSLSGWYGTVKPDGVESNVASSMVVGDMPKGATTFTTLVCRPKPGFVCYEARLRGGTPGSEVTEANNAATDNY